VSGERLDRFLAGRFADVSRSALQRWIHEGRVRLDGRTASKAGLRLSCGSRVEVELPAAPPPGLVGEPTPLCVVHEDEALIVLDKPAGMVVHPGHGRRTGTVVQALLGRGTPLSSIGAPDRPGIVHRLDAGTSGLLVVAKTDLAHHALATAFAARAVQKEYLAVVWGRPRPPEGSIELSIGRSRSDPLRMSVSAPRRGRPAVTRYATRELLDGFALLVARPVTGRTHQIRVHLQHLGHPVVGDARYGGRNWRALRAPRARQAVRELDRPALHAWRLTLPHPSSGDLLQLEAPLPRELLELLEVLRRP
jgi:23S rRNA pseudouridine1911/1915/1917 synthase